MRMIEYLNHQLIAVNSLESYSINIDLNYNTCYKCLVCNKLIFNNKLIDKWWNFNNKTNNYFNWDYEFLTCEEGMIKKLLE